MKLLVETKRMNVAQVYYLYLTCIGGGLYTFEHSSFFFTAVEPSHVSYCSIDTEIRLYDIYEISDSRATFPSCVVLIKMKQG